MSLLYFLSHLPSREVREREREGRECVNELLFSVQLSKCFDSFMKNDCLPRACNIQGNNAVHVHVNYMYV